MKILIICNDSSGLIVFRGMLIKELIKKGNEVEAIVPISDEPVEVSARKDLNAVNCKLYKVPMERRKTNPFEDLCLINDLRRVIKQSKPDLVITYTIKPNVYGGIICRFKKIPYAANITGLGTAFQSESLLKKIATFLNKIALKKAKIVFFENIENCRTFIDLGIVKERNTRVLNGAGVDIDKFRFSPYPAENEDIRFLFIGRIMKEKGIDEFLYSAKRLNNEYLNVRFDIVGPYEEDYQETIEKLQKSGVINYYGYQEDVKPFIEKAHCFVLPSWHEGMANTNLECAAMGRPIITSNIHGCLEAVAENKSGFLCEPKNADSLYEKIKEFIELPYEEKVEMGKAGRIRMEEIFDKRKIVKETILQLF